MWGVFAVACATLSESPSTQSASNVSDSPQTESGSPATSDDASGFDGMQGAIVTSDCLFADYTYAIDILLSCGSERFGDELRLHTFKRHSHSHKKVFNDQLLSYRQQQLWFDAYSTPRCIQIDGNGALQLATDESQCSTIELTGSANSFLLKDVDSGRCATLGGEQCNEHQWTGGRECGGIEHRYLPLVMADCAEGLLFSFVTQAEFCDAEYPEDECF